MKLFLTYRETGAIEDAESPYGQFAFPRGYRRTPEVYSQISQVRDTLDDHWLYSGLLTLVFDPQALSLTPLTHRERLALRLATKKPN